MHKILIYVAYGWLTLAGALHFMIDVLSQYFRGKRLPSPETTLYYGLNSAFALGQVLVGALALLVAWNAPDIAASWPAIALDVFAVCSWLLIASLFLEYRAPKMAICTFGILVLAMALTR